MKTKDVRPQSFTKAIRCDRCDREAHNDDLDLEFHEFTSVEYTAGYASVFGDQNKVEVDLCTCASLAPASIRRPRSTKKLVVLEWTLRIRLNVCGHGVAWV